MTPDPVGPGQQSVWSFPRPAIAEPCASRVQIIHRGVTIADTTASVRTLETSHPPSYYIPPGDVAMNLLHRTARRSMCEWKGAAIYYDVVIEGQTLRDVGWSYPEPTPAFQSLRGFIAFYAGPFDSCLVDGERVRPQPGGFYGGWITSAVVGPFKGVPGSDFW